MGADEERQRRRKARATWAVRKSSLAEQTDDIVTGRTPSELIAMVHQLTMDAWAMSGLPTPSYARSEAPGRIVRSSS